MVAGVGSPELYTGDWLPYMTLYNTGLYSVIYRHNYHEKNLHLHGGGCIKQHGGVDQQSNIATSHVKSRIPTLMMRYVTRKHMPCCSICNHIRHTLKNVLGGTVHSGENSPSTNTCCIIVVQEHFASGGEANLSLFLFKSRYMTALFLHDYIIPLFYPILVNEVDGRDVNTV